MVENGNNNVTDLVEVTDSLEAIAVFRGWKNIFFAISLLCLLVIQGAFWVVDLRVLAAESGAFHGFTYAHLMDVIRVCNGLLMLTVMLYCTTLLFSMLITVIGRLGGMRHICRAFFRSLVMLILIIPWQQFFIERPTLTISDTGQDEIRCGEPLFFGCIFSPAELTQAFADKSTHGNDIENKAGQGDPNTPPSGTDAETTSDGGESGKSIEIRKAMVGLARYYLRFTGYWLLIVFLLIASQSRCARWGKSILRRLEII